MTIQLHLGLPESCRTQAAMLYWQAFGGKLGKVMGPDAKALRYLERIIRADHAIAALDDQGQLLGLAGFKTPQGSFAGGDWPDMWAIYGLSGLLWRAPMLALLSRDIDNERFLLDGICVAAHARGQGLGAALIDAICDEARARGYGAVRLDVVDTNPRAMALYQRLGFAVTDTQNIGALRHIFGFRSAATMVKPL